MPFYKYILYLLIWIWFIPPSVAKISNVPVLNEDFVGRTAELSLLNRIVQNNPVSAIVGIGGIGKTQLANKFLYLHRSDYQIIWWINGNRAIVDQVLMLGMELKSAGLIDGFIGNESQKINTIVSFLNTTHMKWIIVFDNVQSMPVLGSSKLIGKNGKILITSRNQDILPKTLTLHLSNFSEKESIMLLRRFLSKTDTSELATLSGLLYHYPLYLVQAAAYLKDKRSAIEVVEYIAIHKKQINASMNKWWQIQEQTYISMDTAYNYTFTNLMNLKIKNLQEKSPLAYDILKISIMLDNKNIHKGLLKRVISKTDLEFHSALSELTSNSMLSIELQNDNGIIYSMHDAIQEFVVNHLRREEKIDILNRILKVISNELLEDMNASYDYLGQHIYLVVSIEKMLELYAKEQYCDPDVIGLYFRYMEYVLFIKGNFNEAESLMKLIDNKLRDYDSDNISLLVRLRLRQSTLSAWKYADYAESDKYMQEALRLQKNSKVVSPAINLEMLNRLAGNSQSKGDIKKAEEYLDLGNQYVTQGPTINRLDLMHYYIRAKVCWDKGDFKQAYEFSNKSIQNIKQGTHLEGDDLLSYLRNIMILEKLGHGREAHVKMQDFYNQYCQAVQDKNFLAIALNAMAEIAKNLGMLDQAEQNITRSLSILEELYENKATRHKAVAYRIFGDICDEKGFLAKAQGNYLKSEDLYKEIFKVFEIDEISDLYAKLAINSAKLKNPHATLHYLDAHKSLFGKTHKRTFEIINYLNDHNLPF